jgi:hypothetical protein
MMFFYVDRKERNTLRGVRMSILKIILLGAILISMTVSEKIISGKSKAENRKYKENIFLCTENCKSAN